MIGPQIQYQDLVSILYSGFLYSTFTGHELTLNLPHNFKVPILSLGIFKYS